MADWSLKGSYLEACNWEAACPCVFLSPPTERECTVVIGWHVDDGRDGAVRLDGLSVAMVAHVDGNMKNGNWIVGLYVDERADASQRGAIERIWSGSAGGVFGALAPLIGNFLGTKSAVIRFASAGKGYRLEIDGISVGRDSAD